MRVWRSLTGLGTAALILFCATAGWGTVHASQQSTTTVRVVPPANTVDKSNGTIDVKIDAENVNNLGGFQFVLVVDSSIVRPTAALKTAFLGQSGREIFCPDPTIEDAAIRLACVTLREQPAGVDGSGTLANVILKLVATGTTDLSLKEVKLVHPDGTEITSATVDGQVSVTGSTWWTPIHVIFVAVGAAIALLVVAGILIRVRHQLPRTAARESGTDAET